MRGFGKTSNLDIYFNGVKMLWEHDIKENCREKIMIYRDVTFADKDYNVVTGDITCEDDIVTDIVIKGPGNGRVILPPFVDIHIHGGYGVDIMKASENDMLYLSKRLYEDNVGAYMPTTVAKSYDEILRCAEEVRKAARNNRYSEITGIHIEGPFISKKYRGIMEERYIRPCDTKLYDYLKEIMGELKVRFTIAPECEGAEEFCQYVTENGGYVSIGHSGGTYEDCVNLVSKGASSYTHLFNAMSPLHHREPGVTGAGLTDNSFVEVICDFVHLSKTCVELITRLKEDNIILVTDAMEAMGMEKGKYIFCGKEVISDGVSVRDENGRLAGSVLTMKKAVENMAAITGYRSAVKMAAQNPAELLDLQKYGYIDTGKRIIL